MKNNVNAKKIKIGFREILTIVLVAIFLIMLVYIVANIGEKRRRTNPLDSLRFSLKRKEYNDIYTSIRGYRLNGYAGNEEYKQYEAIADYYLNAVICNAHARVSDGEEAKYREILEDIKMNLGEFSFAADDIDELIFKE